MSGYSDRELSRHTISDAKAGDYIEKPYTARHPRGEASRKR